MTRAAAQGATLIHGKTVSEIVVAGGRVAGVRLSDPARIQFQTKKAHAVPNVEKP